MFTNATIYQIGADWVPALSASEETLTPFAFTPCSPSQDMAAGWVPPRGEAQGPLIEAIDGQWLFLFQIEKKSVPAPLVRRKLEERAEEIEKATGRKPGTRERKELKEEITAELMPQAFPTLKQIPVWIDTKKAWLVVGTASGSQTDAVVTALVKGLADFTITFLLTNQEPGAAMSAWLQEEEPSDIDIGRECELRAPGDGGAVVRYKNHPLVGVEEVTNHAKEMITSRLAMTWNDQVSFVLGEDFCIRQIKFLEAAKDDADAFDADMVIQTGSLTSMLDVLIERLGGVAPPAPSAQPEATEGNRAARALDNMARESGGRIDVELNGKPVASFGEGDDPLYESALAVVRDTKKASISLVQRHLAIGYNRAAKLLEKMQDAGKVSAMSADGKRSVL